MLTAGVWLIANGHMDRAQLPLATLLALSSFGPVTELAATLNQLMDTLAAVRRIFAVHDEPVLVNDGQGVDDGIDGRGLVQDPQIEFRGVGFSYESADRRAIDGVSFSVGTGETVALVGRSGAGKTTSAQMLLRFWDPDEGSVSVGGNDLRDFDLESLRRQIALVAQETYLFNTTIRENFRMAKQDATETEIEEAARLANAHEFIMDLSDGYDTVVGERGVRLSGGERQRIALARALLRKPELLILDEATSALDSRSESLIKDAIENIAHKTTLVVIAHRLSTIINADSIYMLQDGFIIEQGRYQELILRDGKFKDMVKYQDLDYKTNVLNTM